MVKVEVMAFSGYRDAPASSEATLWYGPFPFRIVPTLLALAFAFGLTLLAVNEEKNVLRGLECTRPGRCLVQRGSDLFGVRDAETLDVARITRAEVRRSSGKNPSDHLYLVDDRGQDVHLTSGSSASELLPAIQPFFSDARLTELSIHRDPDLGDRLFFTASVCVALAVAGLSFLRAARRAGYYRVSIEPSHVRVERMVFGVPRFSRTVSLDVVRSVDVQIGSASTARVVLGTSEGPDFPITPRFMPGGVVHRDLADRLRDELRLPHTVSRFDT